MTLALAVALGSAQKPSAVEPLFLEMASESGVAFTHVNGATGH